MIITSPWFSSTGVQDTLMYSEGYTVFYNWCRIDKRYLRHETIIKYLRR